MQEHKKVNFKTHVIVSRIKRIKMEQAMNLKHLTDGQLQLDIKKLVQNERTLLTQILYHLKEIEARKLFSSFGYSSLFEYACQELKYSSDQAFRRIQAMRLLREIPEAAQKIDSGELSLSNINQAQKYFKQANIVSKFEKTELLQKLCDKSVREAQKEIFKLAPLSALPAETKKQVAPDVMHVSFNMSDQLESKLEKIRALLGEKSYGLSTSELIEMMADLALTKLQEKKFGKKVVTSEGDLYSSPYKGSTSSDLILGSHSKISVSNATSNVLNFQGSNKLSTLNVQSKNTSSIVSKCASHFKLPMQQDEVVGARKYLSKNLKFKIWHKSDFKCEKCCSQTNLQIDHIMPLALGGGHSVENLRLLCFNCNQRSRIEAQL